MAPAGGGTYRYTQQVGEFDVAKTGMRRARKRGLIIKQIIIHLSVETHTRMKVAAALKKESMQAMARRIIMSYLDFVEAEAKKGGKP